MICPIMSRPVKFFEEGREHLFLFEQECLGEKCMAWKGGYTPECYLLSEDRNIYDPNRE